MKTLLITLLGLSLVSALPAQDPGQEPLPAPPPAVRLQQEDLNTLLGPIALYPDPLIALILPASTFPSDLVMAARFVDSGADPASVDQKPWDDSIKGLVRYPDTLKWMDENLEWTTQLGETYLAQPEDVMNAIQDLRAKAKSVGNLVDTPEQRIVDDVVDDRSYVRIVPAQPEYIYVPQYDPEIIYYERPIERPLLSFSVGFLVGSWLNYDFDWHRHRLYCGDWHRDRGWDYHHHHDHDRGRSNVYINNNITNYRVWNSNSSRRAVNRTSIVNRVTNNTNIVNNNTNITRNNITNNNTNIVDARRQVARPSRFADRSNGNGETVRRAVTSTNPGSLNDRNGRGIDPRDGDRNRDGRNNDPRSKGNGKFTMPRTDAPIVAGDGRRGDGKGSFDGTITDRNRDGKDDRTNLPGSSLTDKNRGPNGKDSRGGFAFDPSGKGRGNDNNGRPDIKKPTTAPEVKDFLPNGKPRGPGGVGENDVTKRNRGDDGWPDLTPGGKPFSPGAVTKNGRGNANDPKNSGRPDNAPEVRRPDVKDFVPGPGPSSPGALSEGGRKGNDDLSDDDKNKNRGKNMPGVSRPQVIRPQVKAPNSSPPKIVAPKSSPPKMQKDSSNNGDGPRRVAPQVSPPKPRAEVSKPQVKRDDGPPAVHREMPKPQSFNREAPPKPKASPAPVHKEVPKASAPVRREAPKVQSMPSPKKSVSAPVHRDPPKPKPQASAPKKSSPLPKPHVSAPPKPAPKPQASPAKKSSSSSDDDKKKKKH